MITARIFKPENRLAKLVRRSGGKTVAQALKDADARIESIRERCIASLEAKSTRLGGLAAEARLDPASPSLDGLYDVANEIFAIAAAFGLDALAESAYSTCDLVEHFRSDGHINWAALDVHLDGVRLLCGGRTEGAKTVLEGLRRVRARLLDRG